MDIDDFDLSEELFNWIQVYQEITIDKHNEMGHTLTEKVRKEIGKDYPITFIRQE